MKKLKQLILSALVAVTGAWCAQAANYLTFTAQEAGSKVKLKYQSGTNIKYSTNGGSSWSSANQNGTTITLANAGDTVMYKGEGVKLASSSHFEMSGKIAASGDVTSLINGVGGDTTLTDNCFQYMFKNCTSLTTAPALPATTLAQYCYRYMFQGCTSLTDIPALDVAVVTNDCFKQMFRGCLKLVVNTTGPGKEWKIPSTVQVADTATFSGMTYWATNMFVDTSGDVGAGAEIVPGTTYYIASAPASADLGGGVYAYDQGNGTYSVNGSGELTKEGADLLKDKGVTSLVIGAGVTNIGEWAFSYWNELKDVTIGDDVTSLASNAFFRCAYVTNLVIGANVAKVGATAFDRCRSLESISFGSLAAAEAAQETYKIVARITMNGGTPVVDSVPEVKINGYKKTLKGKEYLTDSEWETVETPLSETPYHFFKYEYVAE